MQRSTQPKTVSAIRLKLGLDRRWLLASTALVASAASILALAAAPADAGQMPLSAFTAYNPSNYSSITPGPFSLYSVDVNSVNPTQMNEGYQEVGKKTSAWDLMSTSAQVEAALLTGGDIEPVVIGPGGKL